MTEVWKPVVGWETYYEVSDQGRVKSLERIVQHPQGPPMKRKEMMLKLPYNQKYLSVTLHCNGVKLAQKVHRMVMAAFVGPCPDGMEVCHGDGDGHNNALCNLRYDTRSANVLDKYKHGTMNHRVNAEMLEFVRNNRGLIPQRVLGEKFEVSKSTIGCIQRGETHGKNE